MGLVSHNQQKKRERAPRFNQPHNCEISSLVE